jgi:DNA-binding response OmpR family regulator
MTKVLIVEDEETLTRKLADKLEAEGYTVITCNDGEDGLEKIRAEHPDLIVLDVMLPRLDGLSICRIVRNNPNTVHIPIIMLTARGSEVDRIIGLDSGADDYIVKPFSLGEFLARVRVIKRRLENSSAHQNELVSNDIRLNLSGRRFYKSDIEIKLGTKEFDLLAELIRNKGIVLSRDLILAKVWGEDYFVDKRTVDVHIRWLRQKVEDDPSDPRRIVTVRGVGYRFEG